MGEDRVNRNVVTREEDRAIAEVHLAREGARLGGARVRDVLQLSELDFRPPLVYGFGPERLAGAWIAYVDRPVAGLQSSAVILVSQSTATSSTQAQQTTKGDVHADRLARSPRTTRATFER
jgi:hypothetical protein